MRCRLRCPGQVAPPSAEDEEARGAGCDWLAPRCHKSETQALGTTLGATLCETARGSGGLALPHDRINQVAQDTDMTANTEIVLRQ